MTKVIKISETVERIRKEVCKDCEQKSGLCEHAVCQDVITEIGCFFIYCASKEREEQE